VDAELGAGRGSEVHGSAPAAGGVDGSLAGGGEEGQSTKT
jgi:hypothetical protein